MHGLRKNAILIIQIAFSTVVLVSCGGGGFQGPSPSTMFGYVPNAVTNDVTGFRLEEQSGLLTEITSAKTGTFPAYPVVSVDHRFLFVSNAQDSSISRFTLDGSGVMQVAGPPVRLVGIDAQPYQMAIPPSGSFLYVGNTADSIEVFQINIQTGELHPAQKSPVAVLSKATQLVLTNSGQYLYAIGDDSDAIYCFSVDMSSGTLTPLSVSPVHTGTNLGTLNVHPSDKYLFVTSKFDINQASQELLIYEILPTGELRETSSSRVPTGYGGDHFAISPSGRFVYIAAIFDNQIVAYSFDQASGSIAAVPGSPFHDGQGPSSMAVSSASDFLVVTHINPGSAVTYRIDQRSGAIALVAGANVLTGNSPNNIILVKK